LWRHRGKKGRAGEGSPGECSGGQRLGRFDERRERRAQKKISSAMLKGEVPSIIRKELTLKLEP